MRNLSFPVSQQTAITQTEAIFGPLRKRLDDATKKLQDHVDSAPEDAAEEEMKKAKEALEQGKEASKGTINGA